MRNISTLLTLCAATLCIPSFSQVPGQPDLTFGAQGQIFHHFDMSSRANDLHVLSDDRMLVAGIVEGNEGWMGLVARYLPNGDVDSTFGTGGSVLSPFGGELTSLSAIMVDPEGRIVVAGKTNTNDRSVALVARLLPDGAPDLEFGTGGHVQLSMDEDNFQFLNALTADNNGHIVVAGYTYTDNSPRGLIARLFADGTLDTSFGENGFVVPPLTAAGILSWTQFTKVAVQPDGKIVAGGYFGTAGNMAGWVARFLDTGAPDPDFGDEGSVTFDGLFDEQYVHALALHSDGSIIAGGSLGGGNGTAYLVVRLLPNGSIDTNFGDQGYGAPWVVEGGSFAYSLLLPTMDGDRLVAGGNSGNAFSLMGYGDDGYLDQAFGNEGVVLSHVPTGFGTIRAMGRQSDGKIVAAGFRFYGVINRVALLRFHMHDASLSAGDAHWPGPASVLYPNPARGHATLQWHGAQPLLHLRLSDVQGKAVSVPYTIGTTGATIDVSALAPGFYTLLAVDAAGAGLSHKLVVQ